MPKSASNYLRLAIETAGRPRGSFVHPKTTFGYGHNFYDPKRIPWVPDAGRVFRFYGHTPLSRHNHAIMRAIDPKFISVISIRPLPDIVVSYADHIAKRGTGPLDTLVENSVEGYRFYSSLTDEQKYQYIVDFVMPWFAKYMASWLNIAETDRIYIIKYDEIKENIHDVIQKIDGLARDNRFPIKFSSPIDPDMNRNFNQGISGRGFKLLTNRQLEQLKEQVAILKRYPKGAEIHRYLTEGNC